MAHVSDPTVKLPRLPVLDDRLRGVMSLPRAEVVQTIKDLRRAEGNQLAQLQLDRINEVTGQDLATQITALTDAIISALAQRTLDAAQAPTDWDQAAGFFALGSYGRCELAPHSDIDLVVVHRDKQAPAWLREANQAFTTLLWDVGFQVGASMRSLRELEHIISEDFVTATAVLEQRPILASDDLAQDLDAMRDRFRSRRIRPFLRYKLHERDQRGEVDGASLFVMEPNLKTNMGCLRDVQLLRNIGYMLHGSRNLHGLRQVSNITWEDVQGLFATNDHLLGLRCLLHFKHGQRQDVITLTDQLWLAEQLGFASSSVMTGAEQLMRQYYQHTLHVHQMTSLMVDRLQALGHLGPRLTLIKTKKKLNADAVIVNGKVYLAQRDFWLQQSVPARLMMICRLTQQRGLRLGLEFIRDCKLQLASWLDNAQLRQDPELIAVFIDILSDIGRLRPILDDMHQATLLGTFLPEFDGLTCLMQFNSYHQYTVDEHTLLAMQYLDQVWNGDDPGLPGMPAMLQQLEQPRQRAVFALALLLHDMGKFMGSGHVPRGALMVHPVAQRLGLSEQEEDLMHFLVAEHVTLSDASRSRDIHDPQLLDQLARAMANEERLDLLYCLTYCDARAVAEGVLTGWEQAILSELRQVVADQIRRMTGTVPHTSRRRAVIYRLTRSGLDTTIAEAYLANMRDSYIYQIQPEDAVDHQALLSSVDDHGVALRCVPHGELRRILVAAPIRRGLLADLAGVLSGHHLSLKGAYCWQTKSGSDLFSYSLDEASSRLIQESRQWQRVSDNLCLAIKQELDVGAHIAARRRQWGSTGPADSGFDGVEVHIDQQISARATVLDVRVRNRAGLVYHLAKTISDAGYLVQFAAGSTHGDIVLNTSYVVNDQDSKLDAQQGEDLADQVRQALVAFREQHRAAATT